MPHSSTDSRTNTKEGARKVSFVHVQVKKTAIGLCEQNYDELMSNDWVYKTWKEQHPGMGAKGLRKVFVDKNWGRYIPAARATLALLLRSPIDDALKEEIVQVLVEDSTLIESRLRPAVLAGEVQQAK